MRRSKIWITWIAVGLFPLAGGAAETNTSAFFYQSASGQSTVEAGLASRMVRLERSIPTLGSTSEFENSGGGMRLGYEYGVMDGFALGIALQYWNTRFENTSETASRVDEPYKITGWEDIRIGASLFSAIAETTNFYYGGDIGIKTGKRKDTNWTSGRHSIRPYVGVQHGIENFGLGLKASYQHKFNGTYQMTSNLEPTVTGGDELDFTLVLEHRFGDQWLLGLAPGMMMTMEQSYESTTTTAGTTATTISDFNSFNTVHLKLYATLGVFESIDFLPSILYESIHNDDVLGAQSVTIAGANTVRTPPKTSVDQSNFVAEFAGRMTF